jgi:hypothetical protein
MRAGFAVEGIAGSRYENAKAKIQVSVTVSRQALFVSVDMWICICIESGELDCTSIALSHRLAIRCVVQPYS